MIGESDALLRVVVSDLDGYRRFQFTHLTRKNGSQNVKQTCPAKSSSRHSPCLCRGTGSGYVS
ncbi:hypothetical protein [Agrobacterium vitis]|uniref:hypothetical protein n=1 Tax=Agrobacterium vitis TaxID=373 RepID=UPI003B521D53